MHLQATARGPDSNSQRCFSLHCTATPFEKYLLAIFQGQRFGYIYFSSMYMQKYTVDIHIAPHAIHNDTRIKTLESD